MSRLSDVIKPLPNKDLQIRRIMRRRVYPCPSCGENVNGCYAKRPVKKPLEYADVVIPCPDCGTFIIEFDTKRKNYQTVKETGVRYNRFSRLEAAHEALEKIIVVGDGDSAEDPDYCALVAENSSREAREFKIADPGNQVLPYSFIMAIRYECKAIRGGREDRIEKLAHLMNDCDGISKYELLEARRDAFQLISEHRDKLAPALYVKLAIENAIVSFAFNQSDMDVEQDMIIDEMHDLISEFDALTKEERACCPYAAVDAYNALIRFSAYSDMSHKAEYKKLISAMRKAKKAGAPDDRARMISVLGAYSASITEKNDLADKMMEDAKLWKDPLYVALSDYILAMRIITKYTGPLGGIDTEQMPREMLEEVLSRINESLGIMEAEDDITGIATHIADCYAVRGILLNRKNDLDLAVNYLLFFATIHQLDANDFHNVAGRIISNSRLGSPIQKKLLSMMGYPLG